VIDLDSRQHEVTHSLTERFSSDENDHRQVELLLTITGGLEENAISNCEQNCSSWNNFRNVGSLTVKGETKSANFES